MLTFIVTFYDDSITFISYLDEISILIKNSIKTSQSILLKFCLVTGDTYWLLHTLFNFREINYSMNTMYSLTVFCNF